MNIAIDIDDTLTNSFEYFQRFVAEFFGVGLDEVRSRDISYVNLPEEWLPREIEFCKAYFDKYVIDTPFKQVAAEAVTKLHADGHRIVILTARSSMFYADPYKTTREELANGGIVYDKLICTLDKASAMRAEKIDVLIDDLPKHCRAAQDMGICALLFDSKGNRDDEGLRRVKDWKQALEAVAAIASERVRCDRTR